MSYIKSRDDENLLVISHHVKSIGMEYPQNAVIRINVAWLESKIELEKILEGLEGYRVWLDYPTGRTKPPMPKFSLDEAIDFTRKYNIDYFAFSNSEESNTIKSIRSKVPIDVQLVPKIETRKGITNLDEILSSAQTNIIMFDKEDLYTEVKGDKNEFEKYVSQCRETCKKLEATCLELQGVIFGRHE